MGHAGSDVEANYMTLEAIERNEARVLGGVQPGARRTGERNLVTARPQPGAKLQRMAGDAADAILRAEKEDAEHWRD